MRTRNLFLSAGGVLLVVGFGTALAAYALARSPKEDSKGNPEVSREASAAATPAMAIQPRNDPALYVTVKQLLTVEPFFVAGLRSQIAGQVRSVQKDIGDPVSKGEVLVDIQTPDIEQELLEKEAAVGQRQQELLVAQAQAEDARATVKVYDKMIEQRRLEYRTAEASRDFYKIRYQRYYDLGKKESVQQTLIDEEYKNYLAAEYAFQSAEVAIHKAEAERDQKVCVLQAAEADIALKKSLIEVARKSRDRARAMFDYTQITAPFSGAVVQRKVDPGTFVQNASTGASEPLLTIARTDIVTVVMKVPDDAAPYVTRDTEAFLRFDDFGGVELRARVTRFAPWIEKNDRTLRVEVDLYNDTPQNYERFRASMLATRLAGFAADSPLSLTTLRAGMRWVRADNSRSLEDPLPQLPVVSSGTTPPRLIPGMSGFMRLHLQAFRNAYLIPRSAVYSVGGKPYVLEVQDGVTVRLPVRVQVDDGKLAKIAVIEQQENPSKGQGEVLRDLRGDEVIVVSRQVEIGEGQPVKVTVQSW